MMLVLLHLLHGVSSLHFVLRLGSLNLLPQHISVACAMIHTIFVSMHSLNASPTSHCVLCNHRSTAGTGTCPTWSP